MFCNELSVDWDSKNISKLTKIVLDVLRLDIAGFTLKNDSDLFECYCNLFHRSEAIDQNPVFSAMP